MNGLPELALRSIAAVSRNNSSRESRNLASRERDLRVPDSRRWHKAWRRDESTNRVAALRTAVVCSYRTQKRRFKQPQQAQSRSHERSQGFRRRRKRSGRVRCPEGGALPFWAGSDFQKSLLRLENGSPSLSLGRRSIVGLPGLRSRTLRNLRRN